MILVFGSLIWVGEVNLLVGSGCFGKCLEEIELLDEDLFLGVVMIDFFFILKKFLMFCWFELFFCLFFLCFVFFFVVFVIFFVVWG